MFDWTTLFFSDVSSSLHVGAYFFLFFSSLLAVLIRFPLWKTMNHLSTRIRFVAILLTIVSFVAFAITWSLIFQFFEEEAILLKPLSKEDWLNSPSTFVKAYEEVTTVTGYLWSSNLLMWVIPGCIFLQTELSRRDMSSLTALTYTATGFMGAISLSFPLFFAHILIHDDQQLKQKEKQKKLEIKQHRNASLLQIACAIIATISVLILPITVHMHEDIYIAALLTLHIVLAIPSIWDLLVGSSFPSFLKTNITLRDVYIGLSVASFIIHIHHYLRNVLIQLNNDNVFSISNMMTFLCKSGFQNTCQSSISFDVLFTSIVCSIYVFAKKGLHASLFYFCFCPLLSIGCTWSIFLALEECRNTDNNYLSNANDGKSNYSSSSSSSSSSMKSDKKRGRQRIQPRS
jgi:hypothetical protein